MKTMFLKIIIKWEKENNWAGLNEMLFQTNQFYCVMEQLNEMSKDVFQMHFTFNMKSSYFFAFCRSFKKNGKNKKRIEYNSFDTVSMLMLNFI